MPDWTLILEQEDDGSWIASAEATIVYGIGDTPEEAISDYHQSLDDYRQILEEASC